MKPAIHLHIRSLSLPSYDAAQRNAFVAALVNELVRRAAEHGGASADAETEVDRLRTVAQGSQPEHAGGQAGRAIAGTFGGKH
ncbi:hypothetical protein [Achromobacter sp.]|uniref:hypothetical protein n=1 Tax=Achromobacter sp. TaxID=134375 RepID=UPI0028AB6974|nr:hypothetical protein [Achromobacter sp.]